MIAANQRNPVGVAHFERQEQQKGFHTVVAPIDKVTQEEIILIRTFTSYLEQLDQIIKLTVNVAANL